MRAPTPHSSTVYTLFSYFSRPPSTTSPHHRFDLETTAGEFVCAVCGATPSKRCTGCFVVPYCGQECQSSAWATHQPLCKQLGDDRELALEAAAIKAAFQTMQWPTYNELCALLRQWGSDATKGAPARLWLQHYSEKNHRSMELIFASFLEESTCKTQGLQIFQDGGHDAMVACFYIMRSWTGSPYVSNIKLFWDGIGQWEW